MKWLVEILIKGFPLICSGFRALTKRKPNRGTVLIVEDDESDALWLVVILKKLGWDYEVANSGEAAQGYLSNSTFSAIFVDLRLPGMSGQKLLQDISASNPTAKCIVVCGEPIDLLQSPEGKLILFIRKPATREGVRQAFEMLHIKQP